MTPTRLSARRTRLTVALFFLFMLLHQTDKLLIGPLTTDIIATFNITFTQMGLVTTGALIVGAVLYPVWGYLYDRYARNRLLALASAIWGATTWISAIAPTYPLFLASRASTGVDDSSYPGIFSMISDMFKPTVRGKVYGLVQLTAPIGYLLGLVLALVLGGVIGWRNVFIITGSLGLVLAVAIWFGVPNVPRGGAEPELEGVQVEVGQFRFNRQAALDLLRKPSLLLLFAQGFAGVFPWNVITYWIFAYLELERGYNEGSILTTMVPAILVLAAGYPIGGALGDALFKRNPRGRLIIAFIGVVLGAVLMALTLNVPPASQGLFLALLMATAVFMPFPAANVLSTVQDITLPEVRSTATALFNFMDNAGAALSPLIAGIIADRISIQAALLSISVTAWGFCALFLLAAMFFLPRDLNKLHGQLQARAASLRGESGD